MINTVYAVSNTVDPNFYLPVVRLHEQGNSEQGTTEIARAAKRVDAQYLQVTGKYTPIFAVDTRMWYSGITSPVRFTMQLTGYCITPSELLLLIAEVMIEEVYFSSL